MTKRQLKAAEKAFEAYWKEHFEPIFHPASETGEMARKVGKAAFLYGAEAGIKARAEGRQA